MNVLLIQPHYNFPVSYVECPAGSLILLGTMAEEAGHKVKILHLDVDQVDVVREIKAFKPDVLGLTVDTFHTMSAKDVTAKAKGISQDILTVIGGAHPSALGLDCHESFPNADFVVCGEGESKFLSLLNGYSPEPFNLDDIPLPNYDLIDMPRFARFSGYVLNGGQPLFMVMAGRGCPFNCTFCGSKSIWGRKVRLRKPEKVVDEVEHVITKYGAREVFFQDDTFNVNLPWAMEIFNLIIERGLNRDCIYRIVCRANTSLVTKEFLSLAKEAGVWVIFYGVESGNQAMVDSMNKELKLEEVKESFRLTKEAGIQIQASFIIGMPGETRETVEDTKRFIRETKPEYYGCTIACPLPGTELERQVRASGHVLRTDYDNYAMGMALVRTDALSRAELSKMVKEINAGCMPRLQAVTSLMVTLR